MTPKTFLVGYRRSGRSHQVEVQAFTRGGVPAAARHKLTRAGVLLYTDLRILREV